ncbi:MAG TPA: hypothetical protein VLF62_04910 [Candidatus Saccharimonadales bacterium]|nr:hypothetical protein [Candidatus Saccharimonadales bacterium]
MPHTPDIQALTPNAVNLSAGQFADALAAIPRHDLASQQGGELSLNPQRLRLPTRPDLLLQWANLNEIGDPEVSEIFRTCTPDSAPAFADDYRAEAERMRSTGIDVPKFTMFLAEPDTANYRRARLYTVSAQQPGLQPFSVSDIVHPPDTPAATRAVTLARGIFYYFIGKSFRDWRIEAAQEITSFTQIEGHERPQLMNTAPNLVAPHTGAEAALNGLQRILRRAAPTATTEVLLESISAHKQQNHMDDQPPMPW